MANNFTLNDAERALVVSVTKQSEDAKIDYELLQKEVYKIHLI
jgi:hypothetical protein